MKRNSTIVMSEATMIAAVQCYFGEIFRTTEVPQVKSVERNTAEYGTFMVNLVVPATPPASHHETCSCVECEPQLEVPE